VHRRHSTQHRLGHGDYKIEQIQRQFKRMIRKKQNFDLLKQYFDQLFDSIIKDVEHFRVQRHAQLACHQRHSQHSHQRP
jgi:hypothetical protein